MRVVINLKLGALTKFLHTFCKYNDLTCHVSFTKLQSNLAILNTEGNQKLVRYSEGLIYPNVY